MLFIELLILFYLLSVCHWKINMLFKRIACLFSPSIVDIKHHHKSPGHDHGLCYTHDTHGKKVCLPSDNKRKMVMSQKYIAALMYATAKYQFEIMFFHSMFATFPLTTVAAINTKTQIFFYLKKIFLMFSSEQVNWTDIIWSLNWSRMS